MSWYTSTNLHYLGDEELVFSEFREGFKSTIEKLGFSEDVLKDLNDLFSKREAAFNLHWLAVIDLLAEIAKLSPSVAFGVQGRGEELRCIWVREYEDGEESFSFGPRRVSSNDALLFNKPFNRSPRRRAPD
jgi:hypothetical protein